MYQQLRLAVVVPAFREAALLPRTLSTMPDFVDEVVVVDDASPDHTAALLASWPDTRLSVVQHAQNRGVGAAIVSGYRRALELGVDAVVVMAGDAQMDPRELPLLLDTLIRENADYVKGDRLHSDVFCCMPFARLVGTTLLGYLTRLASGLPGLRDSQCGYTVIRSEALRRLPLDKLFPRYGFPNDLLIRLGEERARVAQCRVRAVYGPEQSGLRIRRVLLPISGILMRGLGRRLVSAVAAKPRPATSPKAGRWAPLLVLLLAFALGWSLAPRRAELSAQELDQARSELAPLATALSLIEAHYWAPVDGLELVHQAAFSLVRSLDSNSRFMPPLAYKAWMSRIHGRSIGPGFDVGWSKQSFWVTGVSEGSAAEQAGIVLGDEILGLDGSSVRGQTLADLQQRLLGEEGSILSLDYRRVATDELLTISLERRKVKRQAVSARSLGKGVALIEVQSFQRDVAVDVRTAIEELHRKEKGGLRAVVLDLRGNLGGLLDEAIYLCNVFLPTGLVLVTQQARSTTISEHKSFATSYTKLPLAVLIDGKSASASEIVAAALAENGRAVTIGNTSYGKGSVQTTYTLGDGSGVKLTTSRYLSPSGQPIDGVGVVPMTSVPKTASEKDLALEAAIEALSDAKPWSPPSTDATLD